MQAGRKASEHTYTSTLVRHVLGFPQLVFTLMLLLPALGERSSKITLILIFTQRGGYSHVEEARHQNNEEHRREVMVVIHHG